MAIDVVDSENSNKRRRPTIEMQPERKIIGPHGLLQATNVGRNLERNYSTAKSHMRQFRLNVVGALGPKLSLQSGDAEADAQANFEFNAVFAKDPDARDDTPLNEITANVLTSVKREHDVLVAFDDFDEDDGKCLFWESDQLTSLSPADWKANIQFPEADGYTQDSGIIQDKRGVVRGWIVTHKRGMSVSPAKDTQILKRDRDTDPGTARLIKSPWRLNQLRGTADMIPAAADYQDSYEILSKELQSAKVASSFAGIVKRKEGAEDGILANGTDPEEVIDDGSGTTVTGGPVQDNYDALEKLTGGYIEYLDPDDDFQILDFKRPNVHLQEFLEHTTKSAGASMGLSGTYSTLNTAKSYTAFRGDMLIAWAQFYWDQKFLERRFMDWIAQKRLAWAMRKGRIKTLPKQWQYKLKFIWPEMPSIDPLKTAASIRQELANGTTDYSKLLGPEWRKKLELLAEQLDFAARLGLKLSDAQQGDINITEVNTNE